MKRIQAMVLGVLGLLASVPAFANDTVYYYYNDAQGSPVAVTDASGNVVERTQYAPYGQVLNRPEHDGPGYTKHEEDAATGLTNMQQRYDDKAIGRMLSMDPVDVDTKTGSNFNRYAYVNDNPYRYIDPDGRATVYDYANGPEVIVQTFVNNTQFTDQQIEQQGANLSGQTSQGQQIIVVLTPGNDKDAVHINANSKLDDTSENGAMRSHTDKIGGRDVEIAPNAQSAGTVGHEIGHVLGAGDQYKGGEAADGKTLAKDVAGPTNIMKNAVGKANTQTVNEISKGAASPQNTHVSCQMRASGGC